MNGVTGLPVLVSPDNPDHPPFRLKVFPLVGGPAQLLSASSSELPAPPAGQGQQGQGGGSGGPPGEEEEEEEDQPLGGEWGGEEEQGGGPASGSAAAAAGAGSGGGGAAAEGRTLTLEEVVRRAAAGLHAHCQARGCPLPTDSLAYRRGIKLRVTDELFPRLRWGQLAREARRRGLGERWQALAQTVLRRLDEALDSAILSVLPPVPPGSAPGLAEGGPRVVACAVAAAQAAAAAEAAARAQAAAALAQAAVQAAAAAAEAEEAAAAAAAAWVPPTAEEERRAQWTRYWDSVREELWECHVIAEAHWDEQVSGYGLVGSEAMPCHVPRHALPLDGAQRSRGSPAEALAAGEDGGLITPWLSSA